MLLDSGRSDAAINSHGAIQTVPRSNPAYLLRFIRYFAGIGQGNVARIDGLIYLDFAARTPNRGPNGKLTRCVAYYVFELMIFKIVDGKKFTINAT